MNNSINQGLSFTYPASNKSKASEIQNIRNAVVHRGQGIALAGQLTRALFVCDRDELRKQALGAFQNVFGSDAAEVFRKSDGTNNAKNARIHIATYQTLGVEHENGDANFLTTFYPEDYFTHIVIDECHRSAWGKWSQVLTRNGNAVQIGLTATPRELGCTEETAEAKQDSEITANNIAYFGEPAYEYDIAQAIEDGYLAACEIQKGRVNLDDTGITKAEIIARNPVDAINGRPLTPAQIDDLYERYHFEDCVLLPDRVLAMCQDLFNYLLETGGPEQKAIIFCARDRHADDVAVCLNNLYAKSCTDRGKQRLEYYAFKFIACTGTEQSGRDAADAGRIAAPIACRVMRVHFGDRTAEMHHEHSDTPVVRSSKGRGVHSSLEVVYSWARMVIHGAWCCYTIQVSPFIWCASSYSCARDHDAAFAASGGEFTISYR